MDKYLKRYFWVLHVVLILLISLLAALSLSNLLGGAMAPFMVVTGPKSATAPKAKRAAPAKNRLSGINTDPMRPPDEKKGETSEEPAAEDPEETIEVAEGEYPLSDLPVELDGTLVADNTAFSMAMLRDSKSKATFFLGEGETFLESVELVRVDRDRVVIKREGNLEQIDLEGKGGKGAKKGRSTPRKSPLSTRSTPTAAKIAKGKGSGRFADIRKGITKQTEGNYKVSKDVLTKVLTDPQKFRDGADAKPNRKGGKFNGFKLTRIRSGSLLNDIGLQQGDVITGINGKSLNSMNVALDLYSKMSKNKDLSSMKLEVERNGEKKNLSYSVK